MCIEVHTYLLPIVLRFDVHILGEMKRLDKNTEEGNPLYRLRETQGIRQQSVMDIWSQTFIQT